MFKIGKVEFNKNKTVLIAEAGVNHNGNIKFAKKLIDEAKKSNCDIIKFQTYKAEKLTTKSAPRFFDSFVSSIASEVEFAPVPAIMGILDLA